MTPTTYGRDFAYCLKSHGGVRGFNASLWRFLLRCTLFCHSVATFLTSVSSYEGGCGFEDVLFTHHFIILLLSDCAFIQKAHQVEAGHGTHGDFHSLIYHTDGIIIDEDV